MANGFKTILLVDDDQQMMKLMLRLLRIGNKYTVLIASNGEEALAVSRQTKDKIEVLITDIDMVRMNGVELYKVLKQERPSIEVLFVVNAG